MIDVALKFTAAYLGQKLEGYIPGTTFAASDVKVANVSTVNRTVDTEGKVNITLLQVEEERLVREPYVVRRNASDGTLSIENQEIKLNLYVLVTCEADATAYSSALSHLSYVIAALQFKNYFTASDITTVLTSSGDNTFVIEDTTGSQASDLQIERLTFEMFNLTFDQGSNIWQALGGVVIPYVVYKVRLAAIKVTPDANPVKPILEINIGANGN